MVLRPDAAEAVGECDGAAAPQPLLGGGRLPLHPAFDLAAGFYNIDTYNSPEVGKAYWASAYSLLADYRFSRSCDTYLGIMATEFSGVGLTKHAPINAYSSNAMYGIGLRFRF